MEREDIEGAGVRRLKAKFAEWGIWAEKREFLIKKDKPREWGKCQKRQVQNRHPGTRGTGTPRVSSGQCLAR